MTRPALPSLHGAQHLPTGSDPIPGLFSDLGFLHWGENYDTDALGLLLAAQDDVTISTPGNATNPGDILLTTAVYSIAISRLGNLLFTALNAELELGTQGGKPGFWLHGPGGFEVDVAAAATIDAIGNVLIRSHNTTHSGGTVTLHGDAGVTLEAPAGEVAVVTALKLLGATGASAGTRFAGATTSGAPASGTFQTGDFVIDRSGTIWICTAGGSPGTWADVGSGGGGGSPTGSAGGALDGSYPNPGLASSVAGAGLSEASDVLSVNVDNATLEISSDTLRVRAVPRILEAKVVADTATLATGDGQIVLMIPQQLNGYNLTGAAAFVSTVSSSGTPTIQIRNVTQTADMLSTRITIDASEFTSYTAATPAVIDTGNDDVATGDLIAVDVDVAGTGAKGLGVVLVFELP